MISPSRTRALRIATRLAISGFAFVLFSMHVSGAFRLEILDRIENYLYDARVRLTMPNTPDDRVVIIDIDEASQLALGQWPWPRHTLATLTDALFDDYGVAVLGMDVLFAEEEQSPVAGLLNELEARGMQAGVLEDIRAVARSRDGDVVFAESLIARDVVLGFVFKDAVAPGEPRTTGKLPSPLIRAEDLDSVAAPFVVAEGYAGSLGALQDNAIAAGFFDTPLIDSDGVFRRAPLLQEYDGALYPSLAVAVARLALGNPGVGLEFAANDGDQRRGIDLEYFKLGELKIPVDQQVSVFIPYRGRQESFRFVPAIDVLERSVSASILEDRIALLGASAAGLLDLRATPVGQRYIGVEAHANLIAGLLDENIRRQPAYALGVEIVFMLLVAAITALIFPRLGALAALVLIGAILVVATTGNLWLWSSQMLVVPLAPTLAYTLLVALLHMTYGFFVESRNKRHLSQVFGQYIPPSLVEEIDTSGAEVSLEGETRRMSVLFSDVRSFTTISEGLDARELTQMMNEFLTPFTSAIQAHRGTIDKYMGDCVMAFWGAPLPDPDHARNALLAAFDMLAAVRALDDAFKAKGWPEIRVGVGISSGDMNVGNMGSEFRVAYTVMGDTVNLGSRLEGLTKKYGVDIIVSAGTAELVDDFVFRELDLVRVEGKTVPVAIFEPVGPRSSLPNETLEEVDAYSLALAAYRSQQFDDAEAQFKALKVHNDALLYTMYLERLDQFRQRPPSSNWDGAFDHKTK